MELKDLKCGYLAEKIDALTFSTPMCDAIVVSTDGKNAYAMTKTPLGEDMSAILFVKLDSEREYSLETDALNAATALKHNALVRSQYELVLVIDELKGDIYPSITNGAMSVLSDFGENRGQLHAIIEGMKAPMREAIKTDLEELIELECIGNDDRIEQKMHVMSDDRTNNEAEKRAIRLYVEGLDAGKDAMLRLMPLELVHNPIEPSVFQIARRDKWFVGSATETYAANILRIDRALARIQTDPTENLEYAREIYPTLKDLPEDQRDVYVVFGGKLDLGPSSDRRFSIGIDSLEFAVLTASDLDLNVIPRLERRAIRNAPAHDNYASLSDIMAIYDGEELIYRKEGYSPCLTTE